MRQDNYLSDSEKCYAAAKWLSNKKRETQAKEMPEGIRAEYEILFGGKGSVTAGPREMISSIWRDIAPKL